MTTPKLRPEVKAKWLEALRSGEYEQGREYLHYRDGESEFYCCLGVLCDLAVKEGVVEAATIYPSPYRDADDEVTRSGHDAVIEYGGNPTLPPVEVDDWAYEVQPPNTEAEWQVAMAEYDDDPEVGPVRTYTLAELNDEHGLSFEQIARLIEDQL